MLDDLDVMKLVCPFTTKEEPELSQVGGKGMSLILMSQQGLPVPPRVCADCGILPAVVGDHPTYAAMDGRSATAHGHTQ